MKFESCRAAGTAGECLVRYRLLRWGWQVIGQEEGHPIDLLAYSPSRPDAMVRIQVKSVSAPRKPAHPGSGYGFHIVRSMAKRAYGEQIDVFACVALDLERFVWRRGKGKKIYVPTHAFFGEDGKKQFQAILESVQAVDKRSQSKPDKVNKDAEQSN